MWQGWPFACQEYESDKTSVGEDLWRGTHAVASQFKRNTVAMQPKTKRSYKKKRPTEICCEGLMLSEWW